MIIFSKTLIFILILCSCSLFKDHKYNLSQFESVQFDEDALDAREQQGIAQKGLGTRPMSDRPGMTKEVVDAKEDMRPHFTIKQWQD